MKTRNPAPPRPADLRPVVGPDDKAAVDHVRFPDMADLMGRLHFSTNDGRIWFDDQRMLLMHAKALGSLRRELIERFGVDEARGLLTRMGYHAGARDAKMARKVRANASIKDMYVVGPQMHCLEGIGLSEPVRLEVDVERGKLYAEFIWTHPVEDEEHNRYFSVGAEPMCWMQTGYASGHSTEFMGRPVVFREVECQSMGQAACRIVGKPVEEWGDEAAEELSFLQVETFTNGLSANVAPLTRGTVASIAVPAEVTTDADGMVGVSAGFNSVCHMVKRVAPTQATVLFLGESGAGKEVFARATHRLSPRNAKAFVALNCATLPEHLVESELFGVERGAYTGATQSRPGRFERADGGTLFLDEIGTLSASAQSKLLRALQEGEIERVGDSNTRRVDVRVIAATNIDLRKEIRAGRFREDLFFRLNVFPIRIPPLRERREDIPLLMNHFLARFTRRHGRYLTGFTQRAVDAMLSYDWPGNIREVENIVERGVILATENSAIDTNHLFTTGENFAYLRYVVGRGGNLVASDPRECAAAADPVDDVDRVSKRVSNLLLGEGDDSDEISLDDIETLLLRKAVDRAHGNLSGAARLLGITRPQIVYRLKSRNIVYDGK
jgi:two-component system, NtrC family, response regulator HydG